MKKKDEVMQKESCSISVVIPTRRRPELLKRCLTALSAQTLPKRSYEIVVVDDAAEPEIEQLTARMAEQSGVSMRYVAVTAGSGPAAARNLGWRAAAGEIIAFTDDDCIPTRTWLQQIVRSCPPAIAAGWGKIFVPRGSCPTDYEREVAKLEGCEFVTANCFCRRSVLQEIGGFDERFRTAWREDSDLFFRLLEQRLTLVRVSQACVIHPVRPAAWGISLMQQRKSMFNALLYKKHPELYRERIEAKPPLLYYGMVFCLALALVNMLLHSPEIVVLSMLCWSFFFFIFVRRRLAATCRSPAHVAELLLTSVFIPPLSIFWRLYGALKFRVVFG